MLLFFPLSLPMMSDFSEVQQWLRSTAATITNSFSFFLPLSLTPQARNSAFERVHVSSRNRVFFIRTCAMQSLIDDEEMVNGMKRKEQTNKFKLETLLSETDNNQQERTNKEEKKLSSLVEKIIWGEKLLNCMHGKVVFVWIYLWMEEDDISYTQDLPRLQISRQNANSRCFFCRLNFNEMSGESSRRDENLHFVKLLTCDDSLLLSHAIKSIQLLVSPEKNWN